MQKVRILCIDDDEDFLLSIKMLIGGVYELHLAQSVDEGLILLQRENIDVVFLDVMLRDESGIEGIGRIKKTSPDVDIVMMSARYNPSLVVEAIRAGAADYMAKPVEMEELERVVERIASMRFMRERYMALVESQNPNVSKIGIVHRSIAIQKVLAQAEQLKGHLVNILIIGETGTGKELLARYIHSLEDNPSRPFVAVNCAAIPNALMESELFGSEAGAFTGAVKRRIGKFELADSGDIFLDEVGALEPNLQTKILRVLQEREFCRLGGNEVIKAEFRVIAATNEPLEQKISSRIFRMDLYHRLRVIEFMMPSLRERVDDIPVLVAHFLEKNSRGGVVKKMTPGAMAKLMSYTWPGNVRELANVIQSLVILAQGDVIDETVFPSWAMNGLGVRENVLPVKYPPAGHDLMSLRDYTSQAQRHYIEFALKSCKNDKTKTARRLNVGRTTLYGKMKDLGLM